jgi:adenine-specific DNA-methyltransferase
MDTIQKFQDLLKKLFQFEVSDLDFGIYRVLNYKRERVEKFIQEDLKNKIEDAFAKHKDERLDDINRRFEEAKEKVAQTLGKEAFTPTGQLKEEFKKTPVGKEFLLVKAQRDEAKAIDEIKSQVFNDLYNFFSRYYEEGDFIPQYRYSIKGHKYAIPYNGEEVKLYWANSEQYYTKTGLLFRDYTFKASDYKVIFRIVSAKEELASNKATKERFFVLDDEEPLTIEDKSLIIRFQYRELSEKEVKHYEVEGGSNLAKQEKINQKSYDEILKGIKDVALKGSLGQPRNEKPLLLYHLNRFTAKNTKDYFIHKNLKKFLSEQLDYFIKAEVLDIETLEKERFLDKHITRAKVVREIGEDIIDFLSQIEDFQKRLWEKKKFVLKTEYVITTDRVPEELYDEIWKNKGQKKEWRELGFEIPEKKQDLKNKKLPIDTKHFSIEFKEKLLEKLSEKEDLDDLLDGLLIKSENWQALNTILGKYKGSVKTIYIDPPYNTGSDEFLYKDRYRHASWLTMMENRLSLASNLMSKGSIIYISIDDNEDFRLKNIMSNFFNYVDTFIIKSNPRGNQAKKITASVHEYVLVFSKDIFENKLGFLKIEGETSEFKYEDQVGKYREIGLRKRGAGSRKEDAPNLCYPIYYDPDTNQIFISPEKSNLIKILPFLENGSEGRWRWSKETLSQNLDRVLVRKVRRKSGIDTYDVFEKDYLTEEKVEKIKSIFDEKEVNYENATEEIKHMGLYYSYPKPVHLVKKLIHCLSYMNKSSLVCDFFAGSGTTAHAVMILNKEDGGKRKYILVEMADYFDTVIIPRLKKVCYSFNWKDGKPQDTDGIGIFFKYQILEQYEDTLDNIELRENKQAELKFGDDYLLKYFLDFETRESPYLLNIDSLKNPFSYKLKVNLSEVGEPQEVVVDVPETFNYLLGLKVKKIKVRNNCRKYLFILGEKQGRDIAIVWRKYEDNWSDEDFKKDKEFIKEELQNWKPQVVYVNRQSVLTTNFGDFQADIKYIEPEFKKLMEG